MKAALFLGPHRPLEIAEVPAPTPPADAPAPDAQPTRRGLFGR